MLESLRSRHRAWSCVGSATINDTGRQHVDLVAARDAGRRPPEPSMQSARQLEPIAGRARCTLRRTLALVVEHAMLSTVTRLPGGRDTVIRNDTSSSPLGSVRVVLSAARRPRSVTLLSSVSRAGVLLTSIAGNDRQSVTDQRGCDRPGCGYRRGCGHGGRKSSEPGGRGLLIGGDRRVHQSRAAARSTASNSPSTSAPAEAPNQFAASCVRPAASRASA